MATFSRIAGTGSSLPERILTTADLEKIVDTSDMTQAQVIEHLRDLVEQRTKAVR